MNNLYLNEHHRYGTGFFPELHPVGSRYLEVYYDQTVADYKSGTAIAVLLEPRSMIADAYEYVLGHSEQFRYIFTHDSEVLNLPNARFLNWANVWSTSDSKKDRGISLIASWKNWCPLHIARIELAKYFLDKPEVDVYGSFLCKDAWVDTATAHERYKFAIVIENDIDEYWYTEKILNCFSNKVVPIYVGATKIGDIFDADGIIQVSNWRMIPEIIRTLDIDSEYGKRQQAIEENFNRAMAYTDKWSDRFLREYGVLLEELINE